MANSFFAVGWQTAPPPSHPASTAPAAAALNDAPPSSREGAATATRAPTTPLHPARTCAFTPTEPEASPEAAPSYGTVTTGARGKHLKLPNELWLQVAKRAALTPRDLVQLAGLSRQFRAVFSDNALWYGTNEDMARLASMRAEGQPTPRDALFVAFHARVAKLRPATRNMLGEIYRHKENFIPVNPTDRRWANYAGREFDVAMAAARYGLLNPYELRLAGPLPHEPPLERALLLLDAHHPRSTTYRSLLPKVRLDAELSVASLLGRPRHYPFVPRELAARPDVLRALFTNDVTVALHAVHQGHPDLLRASTFADALVDACADTRRPRQLEDKILRPEVRRSWAMVPSELLLEPHVARCMLRAWPAGFSRLPPVMQANLPLLHRALQKGMSLAVVPQPLRDLPGVAVAAVARSPLQVFYTGPRARRDPAIAWALLKNGPVSDILFEQLDASVFGDTPLMRALLPRHPRLAWRTANPALADGRVARTLIDVGAYTVLPRLPANIAEDADFISYALNHDVRTLPYLTAAPWLERGVVLHCLNIDGLLLASLPHLWADREAVAIAVRSRGLALRYAAPVLQHRHDLALAALDQDLAAIAWTSLWLRDDDALLQRYNWFARPHLWRFLSHRLVMQLQASARGQPRPPVARASFAAGAGV